MDASNPFTGEWTPITSKTYLGQDWKSSGTNPYGISYVVPDGEFYFKTEFNSSTTSYSGTLNTLEEATKAYSNNLETTVQLGLTEIKGDTNIISATEFDKRMEALSSTSHTTLVQIQRSRSWE